MRTRNRVIGGVLAVSLLTQLSACGTVFYPDRRGQIDGKIDPTIAVLNAVGLLFYVIGQIDTLRLKAIIEQETGRSLPLNDPRLIQHSGSLEQLAAFGLRPAA